MLNLTMILSNILHLDLAHHESVDQTRQVALTILSTQGPTMVAMFADYGVETLSAFATKKTNLIFFLNENEIIARLF